MRDETREEAVLMPEDFISQGRDAPESQREVFMGGDDVLRFEVYNNHFV